MCDRSEQESTSIDEELILWESPDAFFVGWAPNADDWVARFAKRAGFPARAWAERMVELHNHTHENCIGHDDGGNVEPLAAEDAHSSVQLPPSR